MATSDFAPKTGELSAPDSKNRFIAAFVEAACTAVSEAASVEVVCQGIQEAPAASCPGNIVVAVDLHLPTEAGFELVFPGATAEGVALRMLSGATRTIDDDLISDCTAEVANVIAGQATAMLAGEGIRKAFSLPRILATTSLDSGAGQGAVILAFSTELGVFRLHLSGL